MNFHTTIDECQPLHLLVFTVCRNHIVESRLLPRPHIHSPEIDNLAAMQPKSIVRDAFSAIAEERPLVGINHLVSSLAFPCGQHVELAALWLEEVRCILVVENIPDLVYIAIEGIPNIVSLCNESSLKIVPCFVLSVRQNLEITFFRVAIYAYITIFTCLERPIHFKNANLLFAVWRNSE